MFGIVCSQIQFVDDKYPPIDLSLHAIQDEQLSVTALTGRRVSAIR